jgi:anti-sigma-K factor RskA
VAAAVLLVVGAVGVVVSRDTGGGGAVTPAVSQVFAAADAHTATVDTSNGGRVTVATSRRLGRMAVETDALPSPGDHRVYQLWAVHNGVPTSAGVVRDLKAGAAMAMPASGTTVAITIEPAGGSQEPTSKPVVEMDPRQV